MYKIILISKYLRRKLAPMFAASAVMLCTMMVIIVVSVMGGFLEMMRSAAQRLTGDVTILTGDLTGFPYYEELLTDLRALPQVAAATPVMRTPGFAKFIDPMGERAPLVEVVGIRPQELDPIIGYGKTLYWNEGHIRERYGPDAAVDPRELGMTLDVPPQWGMGDDVSGMVPGIEISPWNQRDTQGQYQVQNSSLAQLATVTVPIISGSRLTDSATGQFVVVNEFKSGLYDIDAQRIYLRFDVLQKLLAMDESVAIDRDTGQPTDVKVPARTTEIMVKGAPGVPLDDVEEAVRHATHEFRVRHNDELPPYLGTQTWMQRHAVLLSAVQNEKGLITFLFAIIGLVSIVMVATTFYMIVLEKTRDIGVLRALGASRTGIAGVFLGYGLAVGTVGSFLGLAAGVGIVTNLNEIQEVIYQLSGWRMWDPQIYYFDRIPSDVDPTEATVIVIFAIVSSVAGALIPALLAARLDPVEALRYE